MFSILKSCDFPFLTIITMRGEFAEFNSWQKPMGSATQEILQAMDFEILRVEQSEQVVDITPRVMDADANNAFSSPVEPRTVSIVNENSITAGIELRPPLENFSPIDITTERALENRVADIEIRTNDLVDETDSQANINNSAIEAFTTVDNDIQQAVDISA